MPELAKDTVALLTFLLPGFLVAWVLYALTSLPKPVQLERVIQALVFTLFVKAFVVAEQWLLERIGSIYTLGSWNTNTELTASLSTALAIGLFGSWIANRDNLHQYLRRKGISQRSSRPSEWCDVFSKYPLFVTLHFKDNRRLYGWPEEWPSDPDKGHFFIVFPVWTHDAEAKPMIGTEGILVNVSDVQHVEFVQRKKEN
jgi:hypothetical protein